MSNAPNADTTGRCIHDSVSIAPPLFAAKTPRTASLNPQSRNASISSHLCRPALISPLSSRSFRTYIQKSASHKLLNTFIHPSAVLRLLAKNYIPKTPPRQQRTNLIFSNLKSPISDCIVLQGRTVAAKRRFAVRESFLRNSSS